MAPGKLEKFRQNRQFDNLIEYTDLSEGGIEPVRGRWGELFGNHRPVTLELACGRGDYTIGLARRFPGRNFVGVDIKGGRLWHGAKEALEEGIGNVRFLRLFIEQLEEWFVPGEIEEIWITFPDPFLKKRDRNKRLTSPRFLEIYRKLLAPGGRVHLKTDSDTLFDYTLETLQNKGLPIGREVRDIYHTGPEDPTLAIRTTYEQRHLEEGRTIGYICFTFPSQVA